MFLDGGVFEAEDHLRLASAAQRMWPEAGNAFDPPNSRALVAPMDRCAFSWPCGGRTSAAAR